MLRKFIRCKSSIKVADKKRLICLRECYGSDTGPKTSKLRDQLSLLKRKNKNTPLECNAQ